MRKQLSISAHGYYGHVFVFLGLIWLMTFGGCTGESIAEQDNMLRPVESEQIENVVREYFVRQADIPDYQVAVEKVESDWARVTITLVDSETSDPMIIYLQDQSDAIQKAPTAEVDTQTGNTARTSSTSGWTVITEPQVVFTDEELDAAQVPENIRR